jgi:tetratricopeptide (TPR) repeat protein
MRAPVVSIAIAVQLVAGAFAPRRAAAEGPVADAPAPATSLDEKTALAHLDKGVAAFRVGKFADALRELSIAHDLAPAKANPFRWLALTEIQLGDCAAALPHIEEFLARVPPKDERVAEMARWRDLCKRTGILRVATKPSAATLQIDGAVVGLTPYRSLSMRTGAHTLVADRAGYRSATQSFDLDAGGELDVELTLEPAHASITDRWWFWPAVGVVALGITGGVVYAATRGDETVLPPIHCTNAGCMP